MSLNQRKVKFNPWIKLNHNSHNVNLDYSDVNYLFGMCPGSSHVAFLIREVCIFCTSSISASIQGTTTLNPFTCHHFGLWFSHYNRNLCCSLGFKFIASVLLILVTWELESGSFLQEVISNTSLTVRLSLFTFVSGSLVISSLLQMVSPFSMQMLCKTMQARVAVLTWEGSLSFFLKSTLHLPLSCPYAPSETILARLNL